MTRLTAILALLLVCSPMAQIVKAFSIPYSSSCNVNVNGGYDIDAPSAYGFGQYFAYKDGCTAKVVEIASQHVVYQLDLKAVGVNTESQYATVMLYRNLTDSDGSWSAIYYDISLPSYYYTVGVITGNTLHILSETATKAATINLAGGNLYAIVTEAKSADFYLLRNNANVASVPPHISPDHPQTAYRLWFDYDPTGRALNEQNTTRNVKLLRK